jgi:hypothetical protein
MASGSALGGLQDEANVVVLPHAGAARQRAARNATRDDTASELIIAGAFPPSPRRVKRGRERTEYNCGFINI